MRSAQGARADVAATTIGAPTDVAGPLAGLRRALTDDLALASEMLARMVPALTFFGGARVREGDPLYASARAIGARLAATGIPPRTGAGPGIMRAVPEGYRAARDARDVVVDTHGPAQPTQPPGARTQGFNIKLPHEQRVNAEVELSAELALFPIRKLALYEHAVGLVVFSGGFGTLDELFEVVALTARGHYARPTALFGTAFWQPIFAALRLVARDGARGAQIRASSLDAVLITDDVEVLLAHMRAAPPPPAHATLPLRAPQFAVEIDRAVSLLEAHHPTVTFLGDLGIAGETSVDVDTGGVALVGAIAAALPDERLRTGGRGMARALVDAHRHVELVVLAEGDAGAAEVVAMEKVPDDVIVLGAFTERSMQKEVLLRGARAYVAVPGGLTTLEEVFAALCLMQTGKLPRRPLVLVGAWFWRPLWAALRAQLFTDERQLIRLEDLDLAVITDDVSEIARLAR